MVGSFVGVGALEVAVVGVVLVGALGTVVCASSIAGAIVAPAVGAVVAATKNSLQQSASDRV